MKPKPSSSMDCAIWPADSSRRKPSSSRTSALPEADETARLPCFATPAPAAAATRAAAVEMLNVLAPSPPVPAVSTRSTRVGRTSITWARMASAAPAISSAVSPFRRSAIRKPPIWAGVASPAMIVPMTSRASLRVRLSPSSSRARARLDHRSPPQEVPGEVAAERCEHGLGVELHAVQRQLAMPHGHHLAVRRRRRDLEDVGHGRRCERVVAAGEEVLGQAGEDAAAVVGDGRRLAVHELPRAADLAAEDLHDRLMPEADAEHGTRPARRSTIDGVAPASSGRPGPGEMTRCDGASASASSASIASFLITVTSAPSSPNRWARLYVNES